MAKQPVHDFTIDFGHRARELGTSIRVGRPWHPSQKTITKEMYASMVASTAIWDTGATNSTITKNLVRKLGLSYFRFANVQGVNETKTKPVYKVSILLPNNIGFNTLNVIECDALTGGYDILVGMDIINQ